MNTAQRLDKTKRQAVVRLAVFLVLIAIYALGIAALFTVNAFYFDIYDTPQVTRGAADYAGVDRDNRNTSFSLAGEWEFFYGKWIVTDGYDGESDGYISVPGRWTGRKTADGKTLTRYGYASYRITVKNIPAGEQITAYSDNSTVAMRIFANGELISVSGTMTDNPKVARSGQTDRLAAYIADGGDVELVVEIAYTGTGGLTHAPCFGKRLTSSPYWVFVERFVIIMLGMVISVFAASVVMTLGFYRYDGDFTLPVLTGMLCMHFIFSKDVTRALALYGYGAAFIPALVTGILTVIVFALHLLRLADGVTKRRLVCGGAGIAVAVTAYGALYGTVYTVIPAVIFLAAALPVLIPLINCQKLKLKFKAPYVAVYFITLCILTFEMIDGAGLLAFGMEYVFSLLLTIVTVALCAVAFMRLQDRSRKVLRMDELERELTRTRQRMLGTQIKPHFIFNSLTAIRARYHMNVEEGDRALKSFAEHLRSNIDAVDGDELIPFEAEIKNALNYFELENLRADGALTLLLDLEETDFSVPLLCLQPLIENAVKYAGTQHAEGGFISIASERKDGFITVTVCDNGKGFNTELPAKGVGLKNVRERLSSLLGAETIVESCCGKGTRITVNIPVKEKKR